MLNVHSMQPQNHGINLTSCVTFEINVKFIDVDIRWNYLFFAVFYTENWTLRRIANHTNDFERFCGL